MTILRRLMPVSALAVAFFALGCEDLPTADTAGHTRDELLLKKGGGGKPGAPANPVLAFHDRGAMWVMNEDGSNRTQVLQNDCAHSYSSWAPTGDGTAANPYRIINAPCTGAGPGAVADVDTVGGSVNVTNVQQLQFAGSYWDTGVWGDTLYGEYEWRPGPGDEIVLMGSWIDGTTSEWMHGMYVIAVADLPSPTPVILYSWPAGCGPNHLAWSPDGNEIAFSEGCDPGGTRIKVLERATGIVATVLPFGVLSFFAGLDWSRSGDQLAFGADGGMVYTLQLGTGDAPQPIASGFWASWSPDATDTRLAFNTWGKRKIRIIDFATGSVTTLGNGELPDWRR